MLGLVYINFSKLLTKVSLFDTVTQRIWTPPAREKFCEIKVKGIFAWLKVKFFYVSLIQSVYKILFSKI